MGMTSVDLGGLRVRLLERPGARTTGAVLLVRAGSADDRPAALGAAHLAEHLRIAAGPPGPASMPPVRGVTDNTTTRFSAVSLPEDAAALAARLAGLLGTSDPAGTVFEAERQAVLVEHRQAAANPLLALGPAVADAALPGHGLAATRWADADALARLTPADTAAFTDRHYRRAVAGLALTGPSLDPDRILAAIDAAARPSPPAAQGAYEAYAESDAADAADGPSEDRGRRGGHPLALSPELDGLVLLSLTCDAAATDHLTALLGPEGTAPAAALRHGHPVLGRTCLTGRSPSGRAVAVHVLCWRAGADADRLADSLAAGAPAYRAAATAPEALARASLRRRQEDAHAARTPLGAAAALLGEAPDGPASPAPPARQAPPAPEGLALWRVDRGVLRRHV
ncbi:hypothetical protein AB0F71_28760 [Kitasatospora sp. NPDC028055]|uniref:hypothetical protein n=1 Tax=Kitasatospora sp. NPDC028055 TaxID=3155653 RepID=UPI0033E06844